MSHTGFQFPKGSPTPPRRGMGWLFAGAAALGLMGVLSQCNDTPPVVPPQPPADTDPYVKVVPKPEQAWEYSANAIHVVFNTHGRFVGAAGWNRANASRDALDKCLRGKSQSTQCFKVAAYEASSPGKTCVGIGVDYLKALTRREQREKKQATDYVIVQGASPIEARGALRAACDTRAGKCQFGKFVYCNYDAPAPHNTKF